MTTDFLKRWSAYRTGDMDALTRGKHAAPIDRRRPEIHPQSVWDAANERFGPRPAKEEKS